MAGLRGCRVLASIGQIRRHDSERSGVETYVLDRRGANPALLSRRLGSLPGGTLYRPLRSSSNAKKTVAGSPRLALCPACCATGGIVMKRWPASRPWRSA